MNHASEEHGTDSISFMEAGRLTKRGFGLPVMTFTLATFTVIPLI
jgi:hypothetical protein